MPARTARHQHKALAAATAARLERMAAQVRDDLEHARPVSVPGQQIVTAAVTLLAELVALATREEIAARDAAAWPGGHLFLTWLDGGIPPRASETTQTTLASSPPCGGDSN